MSPLMFIPISRLMSQRGFRSQILKRIEMSHLLIPGSTWPAVYWFPHYITLNRFLQAPFNPPRTASCDVFDTVFNLNTYYPISTSVVLSQEFFYLPNDIWSSYGIQNNSTCLQEPILVAPTAQIPVRYLTETSIVTPTPGPSNSLTNPPLSSRSVSIAPQTSMISAVTKQTPTPSISEQMSVSS